MQLRFFALMFIATVLVTACQPIQPVTEPTVNPGVTATPAAPPDLADGQTERWSASAPDGQWSAIGLVALPQPGGNQYYTELRVKKADGSREWTPVAGWSNFGLGYTTPRPLHWSADGRYLYFTNAPVPDGCALFVNASDLQRLDLTDGSIHEVLPTNSTWSLAIAPDGKRVAYRKGDELYLLDLATANYAAIKPAGVESDATWGNFVWSPDSQKVAFTIAYQPCQPPAWSHSLVVVDPQTLMMTTVMEKDMRRLTIIAWEDTKQILLTDSEGKLWSLALETGAVTPVQNTLLPPSTTPTQREVGTRRGVYKEDSRSLLAIGYLTIRLK